MLWLILETENKEDMIKTLDLKVRNFNTKYEWTSNMKKLFENWRKHLNEGALPHSAKHVVTKMRTTNPESTAYTNEGKPTSAAIAALKSLTHKLSDEEANNWLERHMDQMKDAEKEMNNELD